MHWKIEPNDAGFIVTCDGWGLGVTFKTYDGAVRAVNVIADEAINPAGVVSIDYSRCIAAQEATGVGPLRRAAARSRARAGVASPEGLSENESEVV